MIMDTVNLAKRARDDSAESDPELDSIKVKKIKDDLLSLLDDSDALPDRDSAGQEDLDSVIRSFEEEISKSPEPVDPGDSLTELGKLLEDENESPAGIGELWDFQDEFPSYDSFGFGIDNPVENNNHDEYVELGGIFDYSDFNFGSDLAWRPETLPAL